MDTEEWRVFSASKPFFRCGIEYMTKCVEVSSLGRVRKNGVIVSGYHDKAGYKTQCVSGKNVYTHFMVCTLWHGPAPEGKEVCHNDGTKTNNRADNLRWGTRKENRADMVKHGQSARGRRNANVVLTESQVRKIRREYAAGGVSQFVLAEKYKVRQTTISKIVRRARWAYLED